MTKKISSTARTTRLTSRLRIVLYFAIILLLPDRHPAVVAQQLATGKYPNVWARQLNDRISFSYGPYKIAQTDDASLVSSDTPPDAWLIALDEPVGIAPPYGRNALTASFFSGATIRGTVVGGRTLRGPLESQAFLPASGPLAPQNIVLRTEQGKTIEFVRFDTKDFVGQEMEFGKTTLTLLSDQGAVRTGEDRMFDATFSLSRLPWPWQETCETATHYIEMVARNNEVVWSKTILVRRSRPRSELCLSTADPFESAVNKFVELEDGTGLAFLASVAIRIHLLDGSSPATAAGKGAEIRIVDSSVVKFVKFRLAQSIRERFPNVDYLPSEIDQAIWKAFF